ncbi:MAG: hypothetical protein AAGF35_10330 [Pseudomonadota bacterium]
MKRLAIFLIALLSPVVYASEVVEPEGEKPTTSFDLPELEGKFDPEAPQEGALLDETDMETGQPNYGAEPLNDTATDAEENTPEFLGPI